jgi:hypothetical protein
MVVVWGKWERGGQVTGSVVDRLHRKKTNNPYRITLLMPGQFYLYSREMKHLNYILSEPALINHFSHRTNSSYSAFIIPSTLLYTYMPCIQGESELVIKGTGRELTYSILSLSAALTFLF